MKNVSNYLSPLEKTAEEIERRRLLIRSDHWHSIHTETNCSIKKEGNPMQLKKWNTKFFICGFSK